METLHNTRATIEVEESFLVKVLAPYREGCRYLTSAKIEVSGQDAQNLQAHGTFAIDRSCYIRDTGHFNAVEFNMCYNQLAYVFFAECIRGGRLDHAAGMDMDWYVRAQLPNMLIVKLSSSFRKPIDSQHFEGIIRLDGIRRVVRREVDIIFLRTYCAFSDAEGGCADGQVSLACLCE